MSDQENSEKQKKQTAEIGEDSQQIHYKTMSNEEAESDGEKTSNIQRLINEDERQMEESHLQAYENQQMMEKKESEGFSQLVQAESEEPHQKKHESLLVCIDDESTIPTVMLEPSPKGHKPLTIKINKYRTASFMKVETHFFTLQIQDHNKDYNYTIQRRYSDFNDLYQSIFYDHPGYILCPFPGKNLQSFIRLKLGIGIADAGERCELIEKRMADLQKFVNSISNHPLLSNCEQLLIFLEEDQIKNQVGKKRIQKYVEEYKELEGNGQWKSVVQKGKGLWQAYFSKVDQKSTKSVKKSTHSGKTDVEFQIIYQNIKTELMKTQKRYEDLESLFSVQKKFSLFSDFETDNDILLKLCAKHSSMKDFCRKFANSLEISILEKLKFNQLCLEEVEKNLIYRLNMVESIHELENDSKHPEKYKKLQRRLQRLEKNFLFDWSEVKEIITERQKEVEEKFVELWGGHKQSMRKIWKKNK